MQLHLALCAPSAASSVGKLFLSTAVFFFVLHWSKRLRGKSWRALRGLQPDNVMLSPCPSSLTSNKLVPLPLLLQVFFQDDTKDAVAGAAVAANAALVADAVRCMPLPASRMPEHAVPLGHERFSACGDDGGKGEEAQEDDFTVFLTRPCLSFDQVRYFFGARPPQRSRSEVCVRSSSTKARGADFGVAHVSIFLTCLLGLSARPFIFSVALLCTLKSAFIHTMRS